MVRRPSADEGRGGVGLGAGGGVRTGSLDELLRRLRSTASPWQRLGLVAAGLRHLRRLPARQRSALLRNLGLQGLEEVLERAVDDAGARRRLEAALEELEADPERRERLTGALADPRARHEMLAGLGAHMAEVVTGAGAEVATADGGAGEAAEDPEEHETVPKEPAAGGPGPDPEARALAAEDLERAEADGPVTGGPEAEAPVRRPLERSRAPARAALSVPPSPPAPPAGADAAPAAAALHPPPALAAIAPAPGPSPPAEGPGAERSARAILAGLGRLRTRLEAGPLRPEELEDLLQRLPQGWPRRRALHAALASGAVARADAPGLVERWGRPADRRWYAPFLPAPPEECGGRRREP